MKALSIRQPWAHLIIHGGKDIENRSWATSLRGRFLVHAAKGGTWADHFDVLAYCTRFTLPLPPYRDDLQRGGIIGSVELVDCVRHSQSPWFMGDVGFVLANPKPLPFVPCKGRLGFFEVPDDVARQIVEGGAA